MNLRSQADPRATRNNRCDIVTPGRQAVIDALAEYSYLRTEHFYTLLSASNETRRRAVRRLLTLLRRSGYVTAEAIFEYRAHGRGGFPHTSFVYYLTPKGAAHAQGDAPCVVRSPASLPHDVAVSEVHLALAADVARLPHARLHWLHGSLKTNVNPDAIFGIEDLRRPSGSSTFWFFLELERSRQGHWRRGQDSGLVQKLRRYAQYRSSAEHRRDWPFIGDFRVLVAVANERRAVNLDQKLRTISPARPIWITSIADICGTPALAAPCRCPADEPRVLRSIRTLLT